MITFIHYLVGPPRASIHAATRALICSCCELMSGCWPVRVCNTLSESTVVHGAVCVEVLASGEPHGLVGPKRVLSGLSPANMEASPAHQR